ncbi:MAG: ATP synthase subunit I [Sutterella wadsworthensis]
MYAISDMMRISLAQYVIVFLVTVVSAFFVGQDAAYTALMAGLAYAVPTTLLAFLVLQKFLSAYSTSAVAVLGGEFVKILVVVLLLGLMVGYYENLHWPAFIFTIIAVANSYFIVLFKRH